jgi:hypothetical protein
MPAPQVRGRGSTKTRRLGSPMGRVITSLDSTPGASSAAARLTATGPGSGGRAGGRAGGLPPDSGRAAVSTDVAPAHRAFFAAVGLLAIWVGAWAFFAPARVDRALPWLVPPLHARFLGAMYLSGTTFMLGAIVARSWSTVRVVVPMISIWTGMLFIGSLFHLPSFPWSRPQTWVWFAAYLAYPLIAALIAWSRRAVRTPGAGIALPRSVRRYLLLQGVVVTGLGLALWCFPAAMATVWPWPITTLLAQLYGAPFLAYGVGSLYGARQRAYAEVRLLLAATFVFAAGVLLASCLHRSLFSADRPSSWLWFAGFGGAASALGIAATLPGLGSRRPLR